MKPAGIVETTPSELWIVYRWGVPRGWILGVGTVA